MLSGCVWCQVRSAGVRCSFWGLGLCWGDPPCLSSAVHMRFSDYGNWGRFVQVLSLPHRLCPHFTVECPVHAPPEFCSPAFPKQMVSSSIPVGIPHLLFSFNVLSFSVTQLQLQQQEPFAFVHQVLFEGLWAPVHCRWHCCIPVWDALDTQ